MRWKLLAYGDVVFTTATLVGGFMLGQAALAAHVPTVRATAPSLVRSTLEIATAPSNLAEWLLDSHPIVSAVVFGGGAAAEIALILVSPLVRRALAVDMARTFEISVDEADEGLRSGAWGPMWPLKTSAALKILPRLALAMMGSFVIGLAAAALAWGCCALVNRYSGGAVPWVVTTVLVVLGLVLLDVLGELRSLLAPLSDMDALDSAIELARTLEGAPD